MLPSQRCRVFPTRHSRASLKTLPDFDRIAPATVARTTQFSANPSRVRNQNAFRFRGMLSAPAEGDYRFWTSSDDGSQLFIDGRLLVDNDGHPCSGGTGRLDEV